MTHKDIKDLLNNSLNPAQGLNFADSNSAAMNALAEFFEIEKNDPRAIRAKRAEVMALIEEVIDENLPKRLEDRIGDFAEIKTYARDAEVVFEVRGVGKRRARLSIRKGARGGLYQAARLDDMQLTVPTWVETVGIFVTLEEILLGKVTLADLMANILDGFVERMYVNVMEALRTAAEAAPAANKKMGANAFDAADLDGIIRVIAAYGQPVIAGFRPEIGQITNVQGSTYNPNIPGSDLDEIKNRGYVAQYKGVPIIELPNYLMDNVNNNEWLLEEGALFVLPMGEKPVKVALKGDLHIEETKHASGSVEQNAHKILGVGVLLNNNIGIYEIK